jgi:hypothetical protein
MLSIQMPSSSLFRECRPAVRPYSIWFWMAMASSRVSAVMTPRTGPKNSVRWK